MTGAWETNYVSSDIHDIDIEDIDIEAADALAEDFFGRGGQPAIAYGIVRGGKLVHSAGFGARRTDGASSGDGAVPDADTVFRIASMSKSFTASAILLLRDSGLLALDDPAEKYAPELASWSPPGAGRITIRNLLTMTAGFPTDDPWGDRQQGLPAAAFGELLAGGVGFTWAPGTRFEYSNLGYAILGRIVTAASGTEYSEFVRTRLLEPLGLTRTGYTAEEFGGVSVPAGETAAPPPGLEANMAQGYRRGREGWEPVPYEPYGAFAPMGGVFSTVRDLATWAGGFSSAFPPGRAGDPDGPGDGKHPLRAASRREAQLPQAMTSWRAPERMPGGSGHSPAYGFGLFVDEDPVLGRVVGHSGGYPGFGTNMRWHPATGLGVVALANGTYSPMAGLTDLILRAILPRPAARHVALAPAAPGKSAGEPWPQTLAAQATVDKLLLAASDGADRPDALFTEALFTEALFTEALFTENVLLDAPWAERRYAIGLIRLRIGEFRACGDRPAESDTPAHRRWWLTGPGGTVQVQIQLSPERRPRVQSLAIAIPPAPDGALAGVLSALVTWMNSGSADWPPSVSVAPAATSRGYGSPVDVTLLTRRLRMAAAWAGKCRVGAFCAGDGHASTVVELDGEHARVHLALLVNPSTSELRSADVTL